MQLNNIFKLFQIQLFIVKQCAERPIIIKKKSPLYFYLLCKRPSHPHLLSSGARTHTNSQTRTRFPSPPQHLFLSSSPPRGALLENLPIEYLEFGSVDLQLVLLAPNVGKALFLRRRRISGELRPSVACSRALISRSRAYLSSTFQKKTHTPRPRSHSTSERCRSRESTRRRQSSEIAESPRFASRRRRTCAARRYVG